MFLGRDVLTTSVSRAPSTIPSAALGRPSLVKNELASARDWYQRLCVQLCCLDQRLTVVDVCIFSVAHEAASAAAAVVVVVAALLLVVALVVGLILIVVAAFKSLLAFLDDVVHLESWKGSKWVD